MKENFVLSTKIKIYRILHRIGLKNRNFTIVSNNCWGGYVYQEFGMKYNTPFIGLFIFAQDYLKILKKFKHYMNKELVFINPIESKYYEELKRRGTNNKYPIALLGDVELHFLHYKSEEEALNKWSRRLKRINYNNILFKFSDNDLCCKSYIEEFSKLEYDNKICFTAGNYKFNSVIRLSEFDNKDHVEGEWSVSRNYIDNKLLLNSMIRTK